jgi:hypothetical protein
MKNQVFAPKNPRNSAKNRESGNVLIFILIAVALFGALSFVMSDGSRVGQGMVGSEQDKLAASEILNYAGQVRDAVKMLRVKGCSDTQISFHSALTPNNNNTNAPADFSCHVFHQKGGGMNFVMPPGIYTQQRAPVVSFDANSCVYNIGTGTTSCDVANVDLLIDMLPLTRDVCVAINNALGIGEPNAEPANAVTSPALMDENYPFNGTYGPASRERIGHETGSPLAGKPTGCYKGASGYATNMYVFYQVLIAR